MRADGGRARSASACARAHGAISRGRSRASRAASAASTSRSPPAPRCPGTERASPRRRMRPRRYPGSATRTCRKTGRSRSAHRAAETCRTTHACPAVHSRSPATRRRPTRHPDPDPGRNGTAPAARAQPRRCPHRWATSRWSRWKCPWSARPPPGSPCARCGHRSDRIPPNRSGARRTPARTWPAIPAWPRWRPSRGKTASGKSTPPLWRRCRNRRTRSWCRSGWQKECGAAN